MNRPPPNRNWHYATGEDWWTLCRYWADAVDSTAEIAKVTCMRCLLKWQEYRTGSDAD